MPAAPAGVEEVRELGAAVLRVCAEVLVHLVQGLVFGVGGGTLVSVGAEEDDADGVGGGGGGGEEGHEVGGENDVAYIRCSVSGTVLGSSAVRQRHTAVVQGKVLIHTHLGDLIRHYASSRARNGQL